MKSLTNFQLEVLKQFVGVRATTETIIVRAIQSDKAKVRHAVNALLAAGMISHNGSYEFTLAPDGEIHLKQAGIETKPTKRKADPMEKLVALDLPPSKSPSEPVIIVESTPEGCDKQRIEFSKGTGAGTKPAGEMNCQFADIPAFVPAVTSLDWVGSAYAAAAEHERIKEHAAAEARPDFTTLVRQGLEKLNKQFGIEQPQIDNIDLKIETLAKLSSSVGKFSEEVAAILKDTAKDLHRIRYGK